MPPDQKYSGNSSVSKEITKVGGGGEEAELTGPFESSPRGEWILVNALYLYLNSYAHFCGQEVTDINPL